MSADCDWPECEFAAVARATTGCIREHITTGHVCDFHLARAQRLAASDNLFCMECGPPGQRLRVRLRVEGLEHATRIARKVTQP